MNKTDLFRNPRAVGAVAYRRVGYLQAADALNFLEGLNSAVADIVFLDPPFNLGKNYESPSEIENASPSIYEAYMHHVIAESVRVLRPGGSLFLYHLPYWATIFATTLNQHLSFRHWIAVSMKNGFVRGERLYPAHYALLYYTKGDPGIFKRPKLRPKECRHCGRLIKDYGGYLSVIEEKGINLSDFWEDLSPVRHRSHKSRAANELPLAFTRRVLSISGQPGSMLVEPFTGSGSMLIAAIDADIRFVANDLSAKSIARCRKRLDAHREASRVRQKPDPGRSA